MILALVCERIGIESIPLLASPQGGVAEQSNDREAGVVFRLLNQGKTTPAASASVASQHFLDDAATPPCGDARRGITHQRHSFTPDRPPLQLVCNASLRASVHESGDASIVARLCSLLGRLPTDILAELRPDGSFAAVCPRAQHDRDNTIPAPRCSRAH